MIKYITFLLFSVCSLLSCNSVKRGNATEQKVYIEEIYRGNYQGLKNYNESLITNSNDFQSALKNRSIENLNHQVDFNQSSIVIIDLGEKRTGGYGVNLNHYAFRNDSLVLDIELISPQVDEMVTLAFTYPCVIYKVNKPKIKNLIIQNN